jgi:bacterioferritin
MGKKAQDIVTVDLKELLHLLNAALADEWLAYYQYWIAARVVVGLERAAAVKELEEHAADELKHASMLVDRIIQLGGVPITHPKDWEDSANCDYMNPTNPAVQEILQQGLEGERCAIEVYHRLIHFVKDKDLITYEIVLSILKDELEHEEDFEALLKDMA